jgi:hypothetical protein
MKGADNLALVRRPPSALEKAQPGAKRILSDMVADALALAVQGVYIDTSLTRSAGSFRSSICNLAVTMPPVALFMTRSQLLPHGQATSAAKKQP